MRWCSHVRLYVRGAEKEDTYFECRDCNKEFPNNHWLLKVRRLLCIHPYVTPIQEKDGEMSFYCCDCGKEREI